jgi:hypothetical protein
MRRTVPIVALALSLACVGCSDRSRPAQTSAAPSPAAPVSAGGVDLDLTGAVKPPQLRTGWSGPEKVFIWTDGPVADIAFGPAPQGAVSLAVTGASYGDPKHPQRVGVSANGDRLGEWLVSTKDLRTYTMQIPVETIRKSPDLTVELQFPDAQQPPGGTRRLGMAVRRIQLSPAG